MVCDKGSMIVLHLCKYNGAGTIYMYGQCRHTIYFDNTEIFLKISTYTPFIFECFVINKTPSGAKSTMNVPNQKVAKPAKPASSFRQASPDHKTFKI